LEQEAQVLEVGTVQQVDRQYAWQTCLVGSHGAKKGSSWLEPTRRDQPKQLPAGARVPQFRATIAHWFLLALGLNMVP